MGGGGGRIQGPSPGATLDNNYNASGNRKPHQRALDNTITKRDKRNTTATSGTTRRYGTSPLETMRHNTPDHGTPQNGTTLQNTTHNNLSRPLYELGHGHLWDLWGLVGAYGGLWGPMGAYGDSLASMGTFEDPLLPTGTSRGPMGTYGDLSGPMQVLLWHTYLQIPKPLDTRPPLGGRHVVVVGCVQAPPPWEPPPRLNPHPYTLLPLPQAAPLPPPLGVLTDSGGLARMRAVGGGPPVSCFALYALSVLVLFGVVLLPAVLCYVVFWYAAVWGATSAVVLFYFVVFGCGIWCKACALCCYLAG